MKIKILLLALLAISFTAFAKDAEVKVKTNMHCASCKTKIEENLKSQAGVISTSADLKSNLVTVKYDADKTNPENIKSSIAGLGFQADEVKAEGKSCDTQSGKCCSTEKKAKKSKKS